jgi:GNAT superfamily N-acetyltransferase
MSSQSYSNSKRSERKSELKRLVDAHIPVGIIAYLDDETIGWCSVAPKETHVRLKRFTSICIEDHGNTWSIVCFFLKRQLRGSGFTVSLIRAAVDYATAHGAEIVEAYPVEPAWDVHGNWQPAKSYQFMGYSSSFLKAGFQDVTPAMSQRKIVQYKV